MPIGKSRGLSWNEARDLNQIEYVSCRDIFKEETVVRAVLDFKFWGKYPGLYCCFTAQDGKKIKAVAGVFKNGKGYGPRDESVDFSEIGIEGKMYELTFGIGVKSHRSCLKSAKIFSD